MEHDVINFTECVPMQRGDFLVAGKNGDHCQGFVGNVGNYTQLCNIPRRVGEVQVHQIQRYCRDLAIPTYLHELASPSFPIAVFSTIVLYFFLRYLVRKASAPKINLKENDLYKEPSKRDLRFPRP
ncbi:MAG: hypothetical protein Q7S09_01360 [bacterium]|nr:hypothetical protein [bacterium]